jgi:hypothetical protein
MISAQTLRVCPEENRIPLFRIMLLNKASGRRKRAPRGRVDLVQDGHALKPKAFSGATDCDGIRKTMKYDIPAGPFVLQVSGTEQDSISIAILPAD